MGMGVTASNLIYTFFYSTKLRTHLYMFYSIDFTVYPTAFSPTFLNIEYEKL